MEDSGCGGAPWEDRVMKKAGCRLISRSGGLAVAWLAVLLAGGSAYACSVPVYKFAMKEWAQDGYEIVVFRSGALEGAAKEALDRLKSAAESEWLRANIYVREVDLGGKVEEADLKLWEAQKKEGAVAPWMAVNGPPKVERVLFGCPLTSESVDSLLDSPKRREMARLLLKGKSAVWLLVESGDEAKDAKAGYVMERHLAAVNEEAAKIRKHIERMREEEKKLKEQAEAARKEAKKKGGETEKADGAAGTGVPGEAVKAEGEVAPGEAAEAEGFGGEEPVDFESFIPSVAVLRLSRSDPAETGFVRLLLTVAGRGETVKEPMAFPAFGRGRILEPLVGNDIGEEAAYSALAFICGDCACAIKEMQPGIDLLTSVSWPELLQFEKSPDELDKKLPPLGAETAVSAAAPGIGGGKGEGVEAKLAIGIVLLAAAGLIVAVAATVVVLRRGDR